MKKTFNSGESEKTIDFEKIKEAYDLMEKFRLKTHHFISLNMNVFATDVGTSEGLRDYFSVQYELYFNHESRMLFNYIDEAIDEIKRRIDHTYLFYDNKESEE
jgi:hypothetical protein